MYLCGFVVLWRVRRPATFLHAHSTALSAAGSQRPVIGSSAGGCESLPQEVASGLQRDLIMRRDQSKRSFNLCRYRWLVVLDQASQRQVALKLFDSSDSPSFERLF